MADSNLVDDLVDVEYYTSMDAYYYTVDNRPLVNLDDNIRLVAQAVDDLSGSSDRAALAATAAGYALINYSTPLLPAGGNFVGSWSSIGLDLKMEYGFSIQGVNDATTSFVQPKLGVHNKNTVFPLLGGSSSGFARAFLVYATVRSSGTGDEYPSGTSSISAIDLGITQSPAYSYDPSDPFANASIPNTPNGTEIPLMRICVPFGIIDIGAHLSSLPSHLEYVNMRTIEEVSNPMGSAKLTYVEDEGNIASGSDSITIVNTAIDFQGNPEAIELFIDGNNQFDFGLNTSTGQITLPSPVVSNAIYRVRQLQISSR